MSDTREVLVRAVLNAARFKRNTVIHGDPDIPKRFMGEWVAVPREDFDALRDALAAHDARAAEKEGNDGR